jgi:hypothetical protein
MDNSRKQINLRTDDELDGIIDDLRRAQKPIPSISQLIRQALLEKAERDLKRRSKNGAHEQRVAR